MKLMKICKKIRKIIKIRLKNFLTKKQKSILADTLNEKKEIKRFKNLNIFKFKKKIISLCC